MDHMNTVSRITLESRQLGRLSKDDATKQTPKYVPGETAKEIVDTLFGKS